MFEVKNLYVGFLGEIIKNPKREDTRMINEERKTVIIFTLEDNKHVVDIFSLRKYLIWERSIYEDVYYKTGEYAVIDFEPIEKYLITKDRIVSKEELEIILNKLNKNELKEEYNYPKDLILKCIYETYLFLKSLEIEEEEKLKYILELKKLSKEYVKEISTLKRKKNSIFYETNSEITEASIRKKYLIEIIRLEDELNHLDSLGIKKLEIEESDLEKEMVL